MNKYIENYNGLDGYFVASTGKIMWRIECLPRLHKALWYIYRELVEETGHGLDITDELNNSIQQLYNWLVNFKPILYISGSCGNGKSTLSYVVQRLFMANVFPIKDIYGEAKEERVSPLFALATEMYDDIEENKSRAKEKYAKAHILIIDDLGEESPQLYNSRPIAEIINIRQAHDKKTILTTNLTKFALKERYGERVYSRLKESAILVNCMHDDYRGTQRPIMNIQTAQNDYKQA